MLNPVGRGGCWLQPLYLQAQIREKTSRGFLQALVSGWSRREESAWYCYSLTIDQVCWSGAHIRLDSRSDGEEDEWQTPKPLRTSIISQSQESLLQSSVETFHHPVCFGMVSSCGDVFDAPCGHELGPDGCSKLAATISRNCCWHTKGSNPSMGKCLCHRHGRHVLQRDGLRPSGKTIHNCE